MRYAAITLLGLWLASAALADAGKGGPGGVRLAENGRGSYLIYPYYSVRGSVQQGDAGADFVTIFSIHNNTDDTKIVRLNFREGALGQITLAFNLFLPPRDSFEGFLGKLQTFGLEPFLATRTSSLCAAPTFSDLSGLVLQGNFLIDFDNERFRSDVLPPSLERASEGFVEAIELGVLQGTAAELVAPVAPGVAGSCDQVAARYLPGGTWDTDPLEDVAAPTGGLSGEVSLNRTQFCCAGQGPVPSAIRSRNEMFVSQIANFPALAIDDFRATAINPPPETPVGVDAADPVSVIDGDRLSWRNGGEAIASVLMAAQDRIPAFADPAGADDGYAFIVTSPLIYHFVPAAGGVPSAPFADGAGSEGACTGFRARYQPVTATDFATNPATGADSLIGFELGGPTDISGAESAYCWAVNPTGQVAGSNRSWTPTNISDASIYRMTLPSPAGRGCIDVAPDGGALVSAEGVTIRGLPWIVTPVARDWVFRDWPPGDLHGPVALTPNPFLGVCTGARTSQGGKGAAPLPATCGAPEIGTRLDSGAIGSWFNPDRSGEGYIFDVVNNRELVVYWFTYDAQGNQDWYVAQGPITGRTARLTVFDVLGPRFGELFDSGLVRVEEWGSMRVTLDTCTSGTLSYDANDPGVGGERIAITRLTPGSADLVYVVARDQQIVSGLGGKPSQVFSNRGARSGAWLNLFRSGEGYVLDFGSPDQLVFYWFTFDPDGEPLWMVGAGPLEKESATVQLFVTAGGIFGPGFDPATVQRIPVGILSADFAGCTGGDLQFSPLPGFESLGTLAQSITKLAASAPEAAPGCDD